MILYHGSNVAFDKIDLEKGLPAKDFGRFGNVASVIVLPVPIPNEGGGMMELEDRIVGFSARCATTKKKLRS